MQCRKIQKKNVNSKRKLDSTEEISNSRIGNMTNVKVTWFVLNITFQSTNIMYSPALLSGLEISGCNVMIILPVESLIEFRSQLFYVFIIM